MRHGIVRAGALVAKSILPERVYIPGKVGLAGWVWKFQGAGPPPGGIKAQWIRYFQQRYAINVLVEMGTYRGDMIKAIRRDFRESYSVEMDKRLHELATRRFSSYPRIHLVLGSSDQVLTDLLPTIGERCLLWLDAHFAGEGTA